MIIGMPEDRFERRLIEDGVEVFRTFIEDGSRYMFDTGPCSRKEGFRQYDTDQDAWYFGVWVNMEKRIVVTYAEGDLYVKVFPDEAVFRKGLEEMSDYYGPQPPAMIAYDTDGIRSEFYSVRPGDG
jgi:hypothetical protein